MKKEELRHDPVRENIIKSVQYLKDNNAAVSMIIGAIILFIGILSYVNYLSNTKSESASHISGRAQNSFISGKLDEALVKFERVLDEYPGTGGAAQSFVYLASDAIKNNDLNKLNTLIDNNIINDIDEPVIKSAIMKIKGDLMLYNGNLQEALNSYSNANSISNENVVKYQLDIAISHIELNEFDEAKNILQSIVDSENANYNEKNIAEELLAYSIQKLAI